MDKGFSITLQEFNQGLSPVAHIDGATFVGNSGQFSAMTADILSKPGYVTQSPGLADLTNGTQAGVVDQLIRDILDTPISSSITYGVGTTKLFKLSNTTVSTGGSPSWPQTITDMTEGEKVIRMGANLFVFYNKASGGDIATMNLSTEVIDPDYGSSTDVALEKAVHPADAKEDIILFGNGQYVGVYIDGLSLDCQKLDFGAGTTVVDVVYNGGLWWIAVNSGEGKRSQIFVYDGSALSSTLSDEAGVGDQQIGFLYVINGILYVAYKDSTSTGYTLGYLAGRQLKPLRYFSGSLPTHRQKTLYKNTILFASSGDVWSCGAVVDQLPIQISKLADGGHATLGAVASPFGTPMIASTDGSSNHRLAKFSGYSVSSSARSIMLDLTKDRLIGRITQIIVHTSPLGENARVDVTVQGDYASKTSTALIVTGTGKSRHIFDSINLPPIENARILIDYTNGNTTNDCPIRKIIINGVFHEQ